MTKITPANPAACPKCGKELPSRYAIKRHICAATETGKKAMVAVRMLTFCSLVSVSSLLGACSIAPQQVSVNDSCYLRYAPPPATPFSSSGDYRAPDNHCILQLPIEIARGGTIEIAPNAFVDETETVQRGIRQ